MNQSNACGEGIGSIETAAYIIWGNFDATELPFAATMQVIVAITIVRILTRP